MTEQNYFSKLNGVDVSKNTVKKNDKFTYLSWAFAQEVLGEHHPDAIIEVREYGENNLPYLETPLGFFVQVFVTINGVKRGRPFVVSDHTNRPLGQPYWNKIKSHKDGGEYVMNRMPTAFDINTAIQRAFVKSVAEHGLGLYIYAGEDLPTSVKDNRRNEILDSFAEWRNGNPKTERWFFAKETLLKAKMEAWEDSVLEHYFKELTEQREAKAKAEAEEAAKAAKAAKKAAVKADVDPELQEKAEAEKARRKKKEPFIADIEKVKEINELTEKWETAQIVLDEYLSKNKKENLSQLPEDKFQMIYEIVVRKAETASKAAAINAVKEGVKA